MVISLSSLSRAKRSYFSLSVSLIESSRTFLLCSIMDLIGIAPVRLARIYFDSSIISSLAYSSSSSNSSSFYFQRGKMPGCNLSFSSFYWSCSSTAASKSSLSFSLFSRALSYFSSTFFLRSSSFASLSFSFSSFSEATNFFCFAMYSLRY